MLFVSVCAFNGKFKKPEDDKINILDKVNVNKSTSFLNTFKQPIFDIKVLINFKFLRCTNVKLVIFNILSSK